jgi:hypothetical protein
LYDVVAIDKHRAVFKFDVKLSKEQQSGRGNGIKALSQEQKDAGVRILVVRRDGTCYVPAPRHPEAEQAIKPQPQQKNEAECTSCRKPLGMFAHVDTYHRFTPICGECYSDPERARATASVKDDPESWWNN